MSINDSETDAPDLAFTSDDEKIKLIHELQVHQMELESQNEELLRTQGELEKARQQYLDLYNHAPVGYATLDEKGMVLRANSTLAVFLQKPTEKIVGCPLTNHLTKDSISLFFARFKAFSNDPTDKYIDLTFKKGPASGEQGLFSGRVQGRRTPVSASGKYATTAESGAILIVISDITTLKSYEDKIKFQAYHDTLTGLPNRNNLYERLTSALSHAKRHKQFGALLFMDLDRFKNVNDSLGHHVGDELLVNFSNLLRKAIRKEDLLVRMGGDEFVVLIAQHSSDKNYVATNAHRFADHLLSQFTRPVEIAGNNIHMNVSIGVSVFPFFQSDSIHDIIRQADTAMYQSKSDGRGRVRFFQAEMQKMALNRLMIETELRNAIDRKEFIFYYQPQHSADGKIRGIEALMRWKHPELGVLLPGEFISIVEDTGLVLAIGEQLLDSVVAQMQKWYREDLCNDRTTISINVSGKQLESKSFLDKIRTVLEDSIIKPGCLVFEIKESVLMPNECVSQADLFYLSDLGISFSIDDFGTGYSSLSVIQKTPIRQIKIDRQFIKRIRRSGSNELRGNKDLTLVRSIITLAKELGLEVVAEGVETTLQREVLENFQCDLFQGFLLSPPVNAEEMTDILRDVTEEVTAV